jgi:hypothetical protein
MGNPVPFDVLQYEIELRSTTIRNDETWFYARHYLTDGVTGDSSFFYYTLRDSGIYISSEQDETPRLMIHYPTSQGTQFNGYSGFLRWLFGFGVVPGTVVSTNESVTVPLGTYGCHHYNFDLGSEAFQHEYYSENVGLVRSELILSDGMGGFYPYIRILLTGVQF